MAARFDGRTWTRYVPVSANVISGCEFAFHDVTAAPDGLVWFATDNGAAVFNGASWVQFDVEDGLVSPYVNAIFIDERGAVWFATSGGVTRLTR